MSIEEIRRRYPHAATHITEEGMLRADKDTLETWEFEGEQCDSVIKAVGSHKCPKCGSVVWKIGETIIDFHFPFVHSLRVQVMGMMGSRGSESVVCVACGLKRRLKK
jgi:hypothetical protein